MSTEYLLLTLFVSAFASLWLPAPRLRETLAFGLCGAALLLGFGMGKLAPVAAVWIGLLLVAGLGTRSVRWRARATGLLALLALALGFGLLPGFAPVPLEAAVAVKPDSIPYALGFRIEKLLAGFALLMFMVPLCREAAGWPRIGRAAVLALAGMLPIVFGAGWAIGYVLFEPGLPPLPWLASWLVMNLLFVAAVEEAFFRGLVQRQLAPRIGTGAALLVAAVLFGLAHFGGGWSYVLLATVAGLGYGLAFQHSGQRIEAAILSHFAFNTLHLLLFTYPAAAGG